MTIDIRIRDPLSRGPFVDSRSTQTGSTPIWDNVQLTDAIKARDSAFPHKYHCVEMPNWLKSWIERCRDTNVDLSSYLQQLPHVQLAYVVYALYVVTVVW